jgi:hypothetical protein
MNKTDDTIRWVKTHLGRDVRWYKYRAVSYGRIVGYQGSNVLIEDKNDENTLSLSNVIAYQNGEYGVVLLIKEIKNVVNSLEMERLILIDIPDDCLDCGAKGDEPCKTNCPNK